MIPVIWEEVEGDAYLAELLECQFTAQNATHSVQHRAQDGILIINRKLCEHHAYSRVFPVPANRIGLPCRCQHGGQDLGKRLFTLFRTVVVPRLQQHKEEWFL